MIEQSHYLLPITHCPLCGMPSSFSFRSKASIALTRSGCCVATLFVSPGSFERSYRTEGRHFTMTDLFASGASPTSGAHAIYRAQGRRFRHRFPSPHSVPVLTAPPASATRPKSVAVPCADASETGTDRTRMLIMVCSIILVIALDSFVTSVERNVIAAGQSRFDRTEIFI